MVHISIYKDAHGALYYCYPSFSSGTPSGAQCIWRKKFLSGSHLLHLGTRETIVDKMPCLGA